MKNIIEWLANGRVGLSSNTMAMIALGTIPKKVNYPHDPDDLNRCLLLLKAAPEVRESFPKIAAASPVWGKFIEQWDEIEATFIEEAGLDWCKAHRASKTYELMKRVIHSANNALQGDLK